MTTPTPFVHLRVHTEYSLVDGLLRVPDLVRAVRAAGMPAVAVTDQGNLFALVKFYKEAIGAGIKPIVGVDLWVQGEGEAPLSRLTLLCQDESGYRNLTRLVSRAYVEGQARGLPTVRQEWIAAAPGGLIALSGAREGDVGVALLAGREDAAAEALARWSAMFPDRYYLEVQRTGRPGEEEYLHAAVALAARTDTPLVATNDARFPTRDDFEAHEARVCIHDGRVLDDPRRPRNYSESQYLRSPAEMAELFADLPEALANTVQVAKRCNLDLQLGKNFLPDFPIPAGETTDGYFAGQAQAGLVARLQRLLDPADPDYAAKRRTYEDRLTLEIQVISGMGFSGYFLIVADFIRWAREHGVPVGPGRGSGAGSLAAYALGITDLDPLAYDLLFERFLNPERVSLPDFDVDFCMEGRDRVIEYVAERYGRERVSQIITYGSMAAKAVVRDVGRVLGHPYGFVDRIAKLIPFKPGKDISLDDALGNTAKSKEEPDRYSQEFRDTYDKDEEVRTLVDLARKLEGLARNAGKHAGGVVIAPSVLTDFTPLYCEPGGGGLVTQFDKDDVEKIGLVKFDFLGLRTLTIVDWAVRTINERSAHAGDTPVDITTIPLNDPPTYELLKRGATTAVFQLESRGMKELIGRLRPDCFEDIVALVALFRPGPLQSGMVDDFINRKHGRARVEYPHPDLEPILKPTYGVILYQEQVMQIAQVLAGYTLGGADLLRRAMGKKNPEEMAKQRAVFVSGATGRGVDEAVATHIFDLMEKFAGYGFNKSHSAAYALVSYQTAWLKAHHPAAFMAAVLSSDMDNTDKVVTLIEECRQMKLEVLPPDVNQSAFRFAVTDASRIRYGLGAIKGVGEAAIEAVFSTRTAGGAFRDLFDFCRRVDLRKLNRRVLESLIRAGALDSLGAHRAALMASLGTALQMAEQHAAMSDAGQADLFGLEAPAAGPAADVAVYAEAAEWSDEERLAHEKETLGLYLTGHPVDRYREELTQLTGGRLADVIAALEDEGASSRPVRGRAAENRIRIAGLAMSVQVRKTSRGGRWAMLTLDDRTARVEVRLWEEVYERHRELLAKDRVVVVEGSASLDDAGHARITAEKILDMDEARGAAARRLLLRVPETRRADGLVQDLAEILAPYREGRVPVHLRYRANGAEAEIALGPQWRVRPTDELLRRLEKQIAPGGVRVEYAGEAAGAGSPG